MSASYWTVAQTQPAQETRALENLRRQGYEAFFPFYLFETRHKKTVVRAVFPNYVFIRLADDNKTWGPINNTYGISRILTCCGAVNRYPMPYKVPEGFIDSLRPYLRSSNSLRGSILIPAGTSVKVLRGVLQNHHAVVTWSDEERVGLLFMILGRQIEVEFALGDVEVIEAA